MQIVCISKRTHLFVVHFSFFAVAAVTVLVSADEDGIIFHINREERHMIRFLASTTRYLRVQIVYLAFLIHFILQITHVWRSKWTFMKFMYIASKYLAFLDGSLILLGMLWLTLKLQWLTNSGYKFISIQTWIIGKEIASISTIFVFSLLYTKTCSTIYSATTCQYQIKFPESFTNWCLDIIVAGVVLTEVSLSLCMHCWPLPDHYIVVILLLRTYALWGLSRYVLWYIAVFDIVSDNQGVVVDSWHSFPSQDVLFLRWSSSVRRWMSIMSAVSLFLLSTLT